MTDDWLKEYLKEMSSKIDGLSDRVDAHMMKDLSEHENIRRDIDGLKMQIVKWILMASIASGGLAAGTGKAIAAILGS